MPTNKEISKYRINRAKESLRAAKTLLDTEHYIGATSCSYYCVFHCVRSILALEEIDFKKHSAVISYFLKTYVKTEIFDKRLSDIITDLFSSRGESDYGDFFDISREEVGEQVNNAEYFYEQVKAFLDKQP